jgi:predicted permease
VTRIVGSLVPPLESGAQFTLDLSPDWTVAGFALLLAVFCTLVFTAAPAIRLWRQDPLPHLKGSGGGSAGRFPLSSLLVVTQLVLCTVLATAGGLAWRARSAVDTSDIYIARDHLLLAATDTTAAAQPLEVPERIRQSLLALPGVASVSWALAAPPDSHSWKAVLAAPGVRTQGSFVGPDYLTALGVHLLAGRDLTEVDIHSAVINRKLAEALWPGQSALGRTLSLPGAVRQPVEVVGVAPDAPFSGVGDDGSYTGVGQAQRPNFVFLPDSPALPGQKTFHVRYRGGRASLPQAIRAAIRQIDPTMPVFSIRTMDEEWAAFTGPLRFIATLVQIFAVSALLLASVGLYAVVSFQTTRRTREFAIRAALGASPRQTVGAALRGGLWLSSISLGIGLVVSLAAARTAGSLLFGVGSIDAAVLLPVIALLSAVSLLACYLPSRRAANVDPAAALRNE